MNIEKQGVPSPDTNIENGKDTTNNKDAIYQAWKKGDLSFKGAIAIEDNKDAIYQAWKKGDLSFKDATKGIKEIPLILDKKSKAGFEEQKAAEGIEHSEKSQKKEGGQ